MFETLPRFWSLIEKNWHTQFRHTYKDSILNSSGSVLLSKTLQVFHSSQQLNDMKFCKEKSVYLYCFPEDITLDQLSAGLEVEMEVVTSSSELNIFFPGEALNSVWIPFIAPRFKEAWQTDKRTLVQYFLSSSSEHFW